MVTPADNPKPDDRQDDSSGAPHAKGEALSAEDAGKERKATSGGSPEEDTSPSFGQSLLAIRSLAAAVGHDIRAFRRKVVSWARRRRQAYADRDTAASPGNWKEKSLKAFAASAAFSRKTLASGSAAARGLTMRPAAGSGVSFRSWKTWLAMTFLGGFFIVSGVFVWALKDVPWKEIADGSLKPIVVLETADGGPFVRQGPYQGAYAGYDQLPQTLIDAVTSIEDRRFMDHYGIDPQGIIRALFRNFQAGSVVQGGSTITQQLIKLQYLQSDRTLKRKLQELVIAFWLEWKLGKQEILTRYMNAAYLGSGATGMPAATRIYFNKDIDKLDLAESAMLAGLLKAPSQLNPIDNFEGARQRTAVVLDAMVANGKITADQARSAKADFAELHPTRPTPRSGSWFADWIAPQASEIAGASPGSTTVRTTLVPRLQQIAEKVVRQALDTEGKRLDASQAALVAMTPDGAVVAMVGGHDYKTSQFNRAVTALRQPGSTFKLFVFYAAMKKGLTLGDQVLDGPIQIDGWSPENSGGSYRGWVTLGEAFARSLNAATASLAQEVGIDNVAAAARELGINAKLQEIPSLSLGTSEVSLLDLTGAYASVRLGKAPVEPWGILDFKAAEEQTAFRVGPLTKPTVDITPYQSDLLGLMQLVVERGTGREADPGTFAAGKTGTSQENRDAWFVGFTEPLVVGVWVGNDDNSPMKGVTGGSLPARIWRQFMQAAMAEPATRLNPDTAGAAGSETQGPSCNINECSRRYQSFRASDCTYQPYGGERRLCER